MISVTRLLPLLFLMAPVVSLAGAEAALNDVPAAVRRAVNLQKAHGTLRDLVTEDRDGVIVYRAKIERDGEGVEVRVREDGTLLGPDTKPRRGMPAKALFASVDNLPPAVRQTLESRYLSSRIKDIERRSAAGRFFYQVELERDGKSEAIQVAEDGTVLSKPEFPQEDATTATVSVSSSAREVLVSIQ